MGWLQRRVSGASKMHGVQIQESRNADTRFKLYVRSAGMPVSYTSAHCSWQFWYLLLPNAKRQVEKYSECLLLLCQPICILAQDLNYHVCRMCCPGFGGDCKPEQHESCCSETSPCSEGGGDCDYDSDCQGDLRCGFNNCKTKMPGSEQFFDCCYKEGWLLFHQR